MVPQIEFVRSGKSLFPPHKKIFVRIFHFDVKQRKKIMNEAWIGSVAGIEANAPWELVLPGFCFGDGFPPPNLGILLISDCHLPLFWPTEAAKNAFFALNWRRGQFSNEMGSASFLFVWKFFFVTLTEPLKIDLI